METRSGSEITISNTTNKIGIFGGTFNPPHVGHLIVAQYALELLQLERLYIVPSYRPPHRSNDIAPFELRFDWCVKTFELKNFIVSDYEKTRGDISYSLYTVLHFRRTTQLHTVLHSWGRRLEIHRNLAQIRGVTEFLSLCDLSSLLWQTLP